MHTQDAHRRKGYAVDVTIDLCRKLVEQGEIPYLQIVDGNEQSPGLALKCGFVPYGHCSWFGFTVGNPVDEDEVQE
jgi:predicted GNAT family acetyltransferase